MKGYRTKIIFLVLLSAIFIDRTFASGFCDDEGTTLVYINGVKNTEEQAKKSADMLYVKAKFATPASAGNLSLVTAYNPTHLAGAADIIDVLRQKMNEGDGIDDYDLHEIELSIANQLTTQKFVIVAHSQGNLYANELYTHLANKSITNLDEKSFGLLGVATPASFTQGGNNYITSATDSVINLAREKLSSAPANIHIDASLFSGTNLSPDDDGRGHGFVDVYLAHASNELLTKLQSIVSSRISTGEDFATPCVSAELSKTDNVKKIIYTPLDPLANYSSYGIAYTYTLSQSLGKTVGVGLSSLAYNIIDTGYSASKVALNSFVSGISLVGTFNANTYYFVTDNITALVKLFENSSNQGAAVATSGAEQVTTPLTSPVILDIKDTPGILSNVIITPVPLVVEEVVSPSQTPLEPTPEPLPTTQILETEVLPSTEVISVPVAPLTTDTAPLIQTGGSGLTGSQLSAALLPLTFTVDTDTARIYGRSEILLKGTSTAGVQIDIPYGQNTITVTADEEGKWEYLYTFPRGTTTISLHAYKEGYVSSATSVTITSLPGTREPSIAGRYNKAESPYLLERLVTSSEYATVVEPGTVIKFIPSLTNGIYAGCPFYCTGATEHLTVGEPNGEPVIFTTSTDDSILGDTNDDGSATVPVPNSYSWNQGFFADTDMYHTDMRYASLHLYGGDLLLSDYIAAGRGEGITTSYEPGNPPSLTISDTTFVKANIYQHSGTLTLRNVAFTESETLPRARIGNSGTLYLNDVTCDAAFDTCLEGGWNGPLEQIVYSSQIASTPLVFTTPFYIPAAGAIFGGPVSLIGTRDTPLYIHILGSLFPDTPVSSPSLVEQFVIYVNELGEEMRRGWE